MAAPALGPGPRDEGGSLDSSAVGQWRALSGQLAGPCPAGGRLGPAGLLVSSSPGADRLASPPLCRLHASPSPLPEAPSCLSHPGPVPRAALPLARPPGWNRPGWPHPLPLQSCPPRGQGAKANLGGSSKCVQVCAACVCTDVCTRERACMHVCAPHVHGCDRLHTHSTSP